VLALGGLNPVEIVGDFDRALLDASVSLAEARLSFVTLGEIRGPVGNSASDPDIAEANTSPSESRR
jgi:hypothetical protein